MDPRVRDLYKRFLVVGRDYPLGLSYVREQAKAALQRSATLTGEREMHAAVTKGRYVVREMIALIQLKKYRALRKAYAPEEATSSAPDASSVQARADAAQKAGVADEEL